MPWRHALLPAPAARQQRARQRAWYLPAWPSRRRRGGGRRRRAVFYLLALPPFARLETMEERRRRALLLVYLQPSAFASTYMPMPALYIQRASSSRRRARRAHHVYALFAHKHVIRLRQTDIPRRPAPRSSSSAPSYLPRAFKKELAAFFFSATACRRRIRPKQRVSRAPGRANKPLKLLLLLRAA